MRETIHRQRVDTASSICRSPRGVRGAIMDSRPPARRRASCQRAQSRRRRNERTAAEGIAVITLPRTTAGAVDIKSISLLPNVLASRPPRAGSKEACW